MTEPTQAQIDAALRAYSEAGAGHRGGMKAALTAAAQVGEKTEKEFWQEQDALAAAVERDRNATTKHTIERCAQVAESHERKDKQEAWSVEIAAAIRALVTTDPKE